MRPALSRRQEERHVDVAEIDKIENAATGGKHLSGLGDAILHAAVARRFQRRIGDVSLDALNIRLCGINRRFRVDDLRPGGVDGGIRGGKRGLSRGKRGAGG